MTEILKVFPGYDHRQAIGYSVLQHSLFTRSSKPVAITPLVLDQLPLKRQGLTPFTFSRFLVPYLCDYKGWALFLDLDILVLDDIAKLFDLADDKYAIMVSKNPKRFEWASVMLFNCAKCEILTPEFIETAQGLHTINWVDDSLIGDFPREFNHLVGYDKPRTDAKIIHYTQGLPCHPVTSDSEYAKEWIEEHQRLNTTDNWVNLMGNSVHATTINGERVPKYKVENFEQASQNQCG